MTGRVVCAATTPARCAAAPAPTMNTLTPRVCALSINRNTRAGDQHLGKYNGLGGKLQSDEDAAAGMRREAEFLVEQRMKQLKEDLSREAVAQAIAAAEKVLREKTTPDDQARLSKAFLSRIGTVAKEGRV